MRPRLLPCLKGGCDSGGPPIAAATEIVPTLRQFRSV
jgi:hypothetical protein